MIAAYYINLDRAKERRELMERQGHRLGLTLHRSEALTGRDVTDADFARLSTLWERPITRIELAVLMSHVKLWRLAADENRSVAIFEDDALLSRDLPAFLSEPMADFELVNLEYVGRRKFFRRHAGRTRCQGRSIVPVGRDKSGAGGYLISPEGARKALAAIPTGAAPADAFLYASGRLTIGQVEPALAVQVEIMNAKGIDVGMTTTTQIHQPRKRLSLSSNNLVYARRRALTQLKLVPFNLGRGTFYELREPEVDLSEFASDQSSS